MAVRKTTKSTWGGARPGSGAKPKPTHEKIALRVTLNFSGEEAEEIRAVWGSEDLKGYMHALVMRAIRRAGGRKRG